ncbi:MULTISPECIES: restriction endonuclease subunit S [Vibrio]|uniref:restriction endonuclease subunit S n=1 Tax=Vibrio TaxID=662 RepID=UPI001469E5E0|nr:restriction endonuclease subunit S [Vibrio parahaemolyticus]MCS0063479.1 restriction endonuclease subunit S [Vibrio parahaemolyticus]MDF4287933.1 restriction endonuclease subunit S [Vibrio parahaemolyticus]MDF4302506.1 restriction endonuclease subunit S [Vibrio parahaemolyticus]MDF4578360.1 restriction endonuclease subunit S [Vibrio parahaemolyticus]MDF5093780.1 restriction endonuclease subunit S [Vibrio parahaemolyticus]
MNDSTMLNVSTYESYVDSGVHYLGDIPLGWKVTKIKHAANINPSNHITFSEFSDHACFLPMEAVLASGEVDYSSKRLVKDVKSGFTSFKKDDVLLAKITPCFENGKGAYLNEMPTKYGFGSTEFHVIRANKHYVPHFLYYLTKTHMFMDFGEQMMTGSAGQKRVPTAFLENFEFASPSYEEQLNIVSFLTVNIELVDEAIAIKQKQIELLKERKQIIIQQAVTQGLNPNAPMKDSGVDWIGQIPGHWIVKRAKYLLDEINERSETGLEELLSVSHMTGVTPRSEKNVTMFMAEDYTGSKLCHSGDLVINIMWAWMGALGVSDRTGIVSPSYGVFREQREGTFVPKYLEMLLKSTKYVEYYNKVSTGLHSSRLRFYGHMLFDMALGFPPYEEQTQIVEYISRECSKVDEAITVQAEQVSKLKEYKTTLINSAVTGKIKVTELA